MPPGIQRPAARLGEVPIGVFTADRTLVWGNTAWSALLGDPSVVPTSTDRTVVPLPGGHVHFTSGRADRITALLLTEGTPPTVDTDGLAVRPLQQLAEDHGTARSGWLIPSGRPIPPQRRS